jgi:hypothetical protein
LSLRINIDQTTELAEKLIFLYIPFHKMTLRRASMQLMGRAADRHSLQVTTRTLASRGFSSALPRAGGGDSSNDNYVSPFQDIFETIEQGKTFLGSETFAIPEIKYLNCGVPEHVLRFKTTTYGRLLEEPYVRPMEHQVTLRVETRHIPLNDMERMVMKEIVGTRLNNETGVLQLSSSQFGSRIENKRHVVLMLERIAESAKTLASKVQVEGEGRPVEP